MRTAAVTSSAEPPATVERETACNVMPLGLAMVAASGGADAAGAVRPLSSVLEACCCDLRLGEKRAKRLLLRLFSL